MPLKSILFQFVLGLQKLVGNLRQDIPYLRHPTPPENLTSVRILLEHFESAPKSSVAMIVKPVKNKNSGTDLAAFSAAHPEQPS
jgi:hypothetical protein